MNSAQTVTFGGTNANELKLQNCEYYCCIQENAIRITADGNDPRLCYTAESFLPSAYHVRWICLPNS
jgi:hypothetical protein